MYMEGFIYYLYVCELFRFDNLVVDDSINVYLMLQMLVDHSLLSGEMVSIDSLLWLGLNDTPYR